jgi:hypothetical protein
VLGRQSHATLARFGLQVGPEIRQRSAHVGAFGAGTWVGAFAPGSPAHREIRVLKDRVEELLEQTAHGTAVVADQASHGAYPASNLPGYGMGHAAPLAAAGDLAGS